MFSPSRLVIACLALASIFASATDPALRHSQTPQQRLQARMQARSAGRLPGSSGRTAPFECTLPAPNFSSSKMQFPGQIFRTGGTYWQGVAADFNGDGKSDYATISEHYDCTNLVWLDQIAVILGSASGPQQPTYISLPGNANPRSLFVGDLNGDGKPDLLATTFGGSYILFGKGDGTFQPAVSIAVPSSDYIQIMDIDGDGKNDIVVSGSSSVTYFLGDGIGNFAAPATLSFGFEVLQFMDVNGDGKPDALGISSSDVATALNTGSLTFAAPVVDSNTTFYSSSIYAYAFGDLNGDGKPDFVTANRNNNTVTIYLSNGDGTFQPGTHVFSGFYTEGVTLGDMNGDGKLDILTENDDSADVVILLNKGNGTFSPATVGYAIGGYPFDKAVVGDFDGDGKMDIMADNDEMGTIYLRGNGDGTLLTSLNYYAPTVLNSSNNIAYTWGWGMSKADFNKDGKMDFVTSVCCTYSTQHAPQIAVFTANGDGTFSSAAYGDGSTTNSHNVEYVAVGDFNGDGWPDVATSDYGSGNVEIFLNQKNGTFAAPAVLSGVGMKDQIVAADFNGDGKIDLAASNGYQGVVVMLGNGDGTFQPPVTYNLSQRNYSLRAADVNGDGLPDLVVATDSSVGYVEVLLNDKTNPGNFLPEIGSPGNNYSNDLWLADLNGDGKLDVITADEGNGATEGITVMLGNGDGTFGAATTFEATLQELQEDDPYPGFVRVADINGDGIPDIVYTNSEYAFVSVMYGKGDGTFYAPLESPSGGYASDLEVEDVNGDGALDVVTTGDDFSGISVGLNTGGAFNTFTSSLNPAPLGAVSVSAHVTPSVMGISLVPTGTVRFFEGTTLIGQSALNNGTATLALNSLAVGNHSLLAVYTGDANFVSGATGSLNQGVAANPVATETGISPTHAVSGVPALTIVISGHDFQSGAIAQWNGSARATTFVSSTQMKMALTAADLATVGVGNITVVNPSGSPSNSLSFAIDSKPNTSTTGTGFAASLPTAPVNVTAGDTANYVVNVSFFGKQISLTAKCINLPPGATCTYDNNSHSLKIKTSSSTPKGTYVVTVIFTATIVGALMIPTGLAALLPVGMLVRRKGSKKLVALVVVGLLACLFLAACGGTKVNSTLLDSQPSQASSDAMLVVQ